MRRLLLLVTTVVLVDTAFYASISPLLPHYSDELDLSKSAAGVLTASYAAGTLIGSIPGGWLAARVGVKPTLITGLCLLAVTSVGFGFAEDIVLLDTARFVQGVGGAFSWAAGLAWLIGVAPAGRRGELIGSATAAAIVGVMIGPALGGAATETSPELVFSSIGVLAAGLALWAATFRGIEPTRGAVMAPMLQALRTRPVLTAFWLFLLPALFAGAIEVLAPLRLDDLGASGAAIGGIFLVMAAVEAALSPVSGRVSDRRGRLVPIRLGLAGAVVATVLLPLPETVVLLAVVLVLAVAALGVFWAPGMALVSDTSEKAGLEQGLAFALSNLAWAGGHLLGGAGGGALADATSDAVAYGLMGLICALTLAGLLLRARRPRRGSAVAV